MKYSILLLIGFLVITLAFIFFPERKFIFDPLIDTKFSTPHTFKNFKDVTVGMDTIQVEELIGRPMSRSFSVKYSKCKNVTNSNLFNYSKDGACSWGDFAWLGLYIFYDEDYFVCRKGESFRYD